MSASNFYSDPDYSIGPQAFLDRVQKLTNADGSCQTGIRGRVYPGFHIEWGDDKDGRLLSPNSARTFAHCAEALKHVYRVPGTYTVRAIAFRGGPNDAAVTEWHGETAIVVSERN